MRSGRSDSPDPFLPDPPFPGPARTVTDAQVRSAVHRFGPYRLAASTRVALTEFYGGSADLDDQDFDERLGQLVDTHEDLQDLVHQSELSDDTGREPRGVDMPAEEDPGPAGLPDPFRTPDAQLLRQPRQSGDGQTAGDGHAASGGSAN
ncbi:hypothetical protein ACIQFU_10900 [Streptomyces sp. NPDC093065]|uniref:hypothetical protein n=1 Tax=Streptomyces sp. NPDC093065 TaxID=3366021 RepID=UPI00382B8C54